MKDRMPHDDHEKDLDGEVQDFLDGLATDINDLGESVQLDVLEHSDFIRGALLGKSVARAQDWKKRLEDVLLLMRDVYDEVSDIYSQLGGSPDRAEGWRELRAWRKSLLGSGFARSMTARPGPSMRGWTADYSGLEARTVALVSKMESLKEWYEELGEVVDRPDVDDFTHFRDTVRAHLDDKRVKFLRGNPSRRDSGLSEDHDDR